jgi:hypothetical protein
MFDLSGKHDSQSVMLEIPARDLVQRTLALFVPLKSQKQGRMVAAAIIPF